jgi:ribose/xylose/arabinose/galactoside ABC-type transport system permease subunit
MVISLAVIAVVTLGSGLLLAGVWKYWRKSTIARIAQVLAFLSLLNIFSGEWVTALGGFILYGAIWRFAYRKMNYEESIDYKTFLGRFK